MDSISPFRIATGLASKLVSSESSHCAKVRQWLTPRAERWPPQHAFSSDLDPSAVDDDAATLCASRMSLSRSRRESSVSAESAAGPPLSVYSSVGAAAHVLSTRTSSGGLIINSVQVDTAIALAVRARQEDRVGNCEVASRLFAAALERMSGALRNTERVSDPDVRERLDMLRLLLGSGHGTNLVECRGSGASSTDTSPEDLALRSEDYCLQDGNARSASEYAANGAAAASAYAASLVYRMVVMWLVILGNTLVWLAVQFKHSQMPEYAAKFCAQLGMWMYAKCVEFSVVDHAVHTARQAVGWLAMVDSEARFSHSLWFAVTSVLSAVVRVAEDTKNRNSI